MKKFYSRILLLSSIVMGLHINILISGEKDFDSSSAGSFFDIKDLSSLEGLTTYWYQTENMNPEDIIDAEYLSLKLTNKISQHEDYFLSRINPTVVRMLIRDGLISVLNQDLALEYTITSLGGGTENSGIFKITNNNNESFIIKFFGEKSFLTKEKNQTSDEKRQSTNAFKNSLKKGVIEELKTRKMFTQEVIMPNFERGTLIIPETIGCYAFDDFSIPFCFTVSRFAQGESLTDILSNNDLNTLLKKGIFYSIGQKLAAFHAMSLECTHEKSADFPDFFETLHTYKAFLHKDLQPSNIFYDSDNDMMSLIDISGLGSEFNQNKQPVAADIIYFLSTVFRNMSSLSIMQKYIIKEPFLKGYVDRLSELDKFCKENDRDDFFDELMDTMVESFNLSIMRE